MSAPRLHVVLVHPEIPENTGNIGRTCVAVGAKLWLVRPLGFRMDERRLKRAGLDYWQHLQWEIADDWTAFCLRLPDARPYFFTKTARRLYTDVDYQADDVLVFGSETSGLPKSLIAENEQRSVKIPMRSQARSLNLANSVAIAVYEAVRQGAAARTTIQR